MYCKNCGKNVTEYSNFCLYCGIKLNKEKESYKHQEEINSTKNMFFAFGLVLIAIGIVGPILPVGIFIGNSRIPYSVREFGDLCRSNLGEIGRLLSSGINQN